MNLIIGIIAALCFLAAIFLLVSSSGERLPSQAPEATPPPQEPTIKIPETSPYATTVKEFSFDSSLMTPIEILFSLQGRINRTQWWTYSILIPFAFLLIALPLVIFRLTAGLIILVCLPGWCKVALDVKRWHDRDKSGWWEFIVFVPFIGQLWHFIELGFLAGTEGENTYGQ